MCCHISSERRTTDDRREHQQRQLQQARKGETHMQLSPQSGVFRLAVTRPYHHLNNIEIMCHREPYNRGAASSTHAGIEKPSALKPLHVIPHHGDPNRRHLASVPLCVLSHLQRLRLTCASGIACTKPACTSALQSHSCAQCGGSLFVACERRARTPGRHLNGLPQSRQP